MVLLFCLSIISLIFFIYGFVTEVESGHKVLYGLLTASLIFKLLKSFFEWYHYVGLTEVAHRVDIKKHFTVDMFTTACPGEPYDMIKNTLESMVAVTYPHTTYLCDEGNDPALKALCEKLGVIHVTREIHDHAKAGNINNALRQSHGELCVILDPDHAPTPDFLDAVLPYFDDEELGYVQVVQAYENQGESLVAQGAAEQTYMFYGPLMTVMSKFGTAQAIGANCTFRREALNSIGGHAPGLTEDMHTSMLLHAKGWKSKYVPQIVSRGLVPSSLSAYYSQQLKWSRGTFDLWVNLVPKLFNKFTLAQKAHYVLMPIYYLVGLVTLIDIFIPIYSLLTGNYPWLLNPTKFFNFYIPLLVVSLLFRWKAQSWLMEKHEKGLHLAGGILRLGTWWIYIIGLFYTIINHKVPYIPTPKEHSSKNEFWLGMPNLIVSIISVAAIVYGVQRDFQPYSLLMAVFAFFNAVFFFLAFIFGQTQLMQSLKHGTKALLGKLSLDRYVGKVSRAARPLKYPLAILSMFVFLFFSNFKLIRDSYVNWTSNDKEITVGGFYLGIYSPDYNDAFEESWVQDISEEVDRDFEIISTYIAWGDQELPESNWARIIKNGHIPMITWEPFTNNFEQFSSHPDISQNKKVFEYILSGHFDEYIDKFAVALKNLNYPVFLRFAHEMENPMYPWSRTGGNSPEDFKNAWKYVHQRFDRLGVHNVSWVWSPWSAEEMEAYFPFGESGSPFHYVDWISLTSLNYGKAAENQKNVDFDELYLPFRDKFISLKLNLPIMLAEFGSTSYSSGSESWNSKSLNHISKNYQEIKSVVFFYSDQDKNWITGWRPTPDVKFIDWTFDLKSVATSLSSFPTSVYQIAQKSTVYREASITSSSKASSIQGKYGEFVWQVNGEKDFFMKGVAYNPGHDWEDGFYPLSKSQIAQDFNKIKAMGANTIRRYEPSIYDRNIYRTAQEQGLKVMCGFWFDPKIDYLKDKRALEKYEEKVLSYVTSHVDNQSIIAWNIGNETYGLLKKHFAKPYLNLNRIAYLKFLENLAVKIHAIDPERPIFSSEEHDQLRLMSTIRDFSIFAPSIDVIGVNSYYRENISMLHEIVSQSDTLRPYAVTEFGPNGYWNKQYGSFYNDSILLEEGSLAKAEWYAEQWLDFIQANKGHLLGGVAYSWRDRYEGTATWFGLTDFEGRLKPAYHALSRVWKGEGGGNIHDMPEVNIVGHWYPANPGQKYWVSSATTNDYQGELKYSWEILNEETWEKIDAISQTLLDNKFVEIEIPSGKARYRVYVYATDGVGNVYTASRPLLIN